MQKNMLSPEEIEKIADENGEINRYSIWKTNWATRSYSLFAGAMIGILTGVGIGALTALSTFLVGAPVMALLLPTIGIFAAGGMVMGMAVLTTVGSTTGASVAAIKLKDRKQLLKDPTANVEESLKYKELTQGKRTSILPFTKGSAQILNLRNMMVFTGIGLALGIFLVATGGAAILAGPAAATITGIVGTAAAPHVISCMTIAASTFFGSIFGFDYPTITANMVEFVGDVFSGKIFSFGKSRTPALDKAASVLEVGPAHCGRSAQVQAPVVFKNTTTNTLASPISGYAGKPPAAHMQRLAAEQQLKAMKPEQMSKN